jgi:hypothetical protein
VWRKRRGQIKPGEKERKPKIKKGFKMVQLSVNWPSYSEEKKKGGGLSELALF